MKKGGEEEEKRRKREEERKKRCEGGTKSTLIAGFDCLLWIH